MLMTREDRTGRGYCPGCNFEVVEDFHTDTLCYFSSGYAVLCEFCQEFDDFSYDMISIRNEAQRAIDDIRNGMTVVESDIEVLREKLIGYAQNPNTLTYEKGK